MINYYLKAKFRNHGKAVVTFTRDDNAINIFSINKIILRYR